MAGGTLKTAVLGRRGVWSSAVGNSEMTLCGVCWQKFFWFQNNCGLKASLVGGGGGGGLHLLASELLKLTLVLDHRKQLDY